MVKHRQSSPNSSPNKGQQQKNKTKKTKKTGKDSRTREGEGKEQNSSISPLRASSDSGDHTSTLQVGETSHIERDECIPGAVSDDGRLLNAGQTPRKAVKARAVPPAANTSLASGIGVGSRPPLNPRRLQRSNTAPELQVQLEREEDADPATKRLASALRRDGGRRDKKRHHSSGDASRGVSFNLDANTFHEYQNSFVGKELYRRSRALRRVSRRFEGSFWTRPDLRERLSLPEFEAADSGGGGGGGGGVGVGGGNNGVNGNFAKDNRDSNSSNSSKPTVAKDSSKTLLSSLRMSLRLQFCWLLPTIVIGFAAAALYSLFVGAVRSQHTLPL